MSDENDEIEGPVHSLLMSWSKVCVSRQTERRPLYIYTYICAFVNIRECFGIVYVEVIVY